MIVGILKEIKAEENRVSMTPAGVEVMRHAGHRITSYNVCYTKLLRYFLRPRAGNSGRTSPWHGPCTRIWAEQEVAMVLGHVVPAHCPPGQHFRRVACETARKAQRAARAELKHGKARIRRWNDGLYDLVDRGARERYEGKRQPGI